MSKYKTNTENPILERVIDSIILTRSLDITYEEYWFNSYVLAVPPINLTKQLEQVTRDELLNCDGILREFCRLFSYLLYSTEDNLNYFRQQEYKGKLNQKLNFLSRGAMFSWKRCIQVYIILLNVDNTAMTPILLSSNLQKMFMQSCW